MADNQVDLDSKGIRDFLNGPEVRADLSRRIARVASAAGPGHKTAIQQGPDRLRGAVWTASFEAKQAEANSHALIRALDAAG